MKRTTIDFKELLERLLPVEELPPADRLRVQRALRSGVSAQIEQASLHALRQLESAGVLSRLAPASAAEPHRIQYQSRGKLDVITLELPAPERREGLVFHPRGSLVAGANTSLEEVRRLMTLDDSVGLSEPRLGTARLGLFEMLDQAGRELLGAREVRFVPREPDDDAALPRPLTAEFALEVLGHPGHVVSCPDTLKAPRLELESAPHGIRSVAAVAVCPERGEPHGHLEALSDHPDAFTPRELALLALLADCTTIAWERAERIEALVFIDPLTAAYNRSYFDRQLVNEIARAQRDGASFAMCIADIDNFKNFNTAYGYEAGNQVLKHVAHTLKSGVRPFDTVARWGGEEFAILLSSPVQGDDVVTICERLRSLVERQIVHIESLDRQVHRVSVSVSMGVALHPDDAKSPKDLWRAANQALLQAKQPPKNRVAYYGSGDRRSRAF